MQTSPIVETTAGRVAGTIEDSLAVFKGIPYAAPPVGPLRFRPPQPATPWTGVRQADTWGKWAPQPPSPDAAGLGGEEIGQDEDCLTLNVWTPAVDGGKRPVMVWIHGGAFVTGAGSGLLYRGEQLAARGDVVIVTINYRLGALGFAAHPALADPETGIQANWGLLDQVAALRWVNDNIAGFGGDPANVTVFGESAGAMSVSTLLGMPMAQGTFTKAIAQSGGPVGVLLQNGIDATEELAQTLGLATGEVGRLRETPVDALIGAQAAVSAKRLVGGVLPFTPVIDGKVVPQAPLEAIAAGVHGDVPLLAGTNADEMRFFAIGDRAAFSLDEPALIRRLERIAGDRAEQAAKTYASARADRGQPATPSDVWFAVSSDQVFRVPCTRMLAAHAAHQSNTYSYLFTWPSPVFDGALGACHALEIPFVFGKVNQPAMAMFVGSGPEADRLSSRMQDAWLSFARDGKPTSSDLDAWPAYDSERRATMVFDRQCAVEDAPMEPERAFWDDLV
jgi:para-nitrobenzyl esterase